MAQADSADERCRALTADGERCSRPAREDGFCYQHGPADETVDESGGGDGATTEETGERDGGGEASADETDGNEQGDGGTAEESAGATGDGGERIDGIDDVMDARDAVQQVARELIDHPFDGIIEIERDDDDWRAVIEVIERSAVPDTQDILGRYVIRLRDDGGVKGYRLTDRYRRGDTSAESL